MGGDDEKTGLYARGRMRCHRIVCMVVAMAVGRLTGSPVAWTHGAGVTAAMLAATQEHGGPSTGLPHNIPQFCESETIASVKSGGWSDPQTWSLGRVPGANDAVHIEANTDVLYDTVGSETLDCIRIEDMGQLRFKTDANTRLKVGTLMVMAMGYLEIGTEANPVQGTATAELVIADKPLDAMMDPEQFGTALIVIGKIRIHGALRTPTFVRLAQEPKAGTNILFTASPVGQQPGDPQAPPGAWQPGDLVILPDTRRLTLAERQNYVPQLETLPIAQILGGNQVVLAGTLKFDHHGARNGDGVLEYLPHAANMTRNVIVRSENPLGTRGHIIAVERADVDVRYASLKELGRTKAAGANSA